MLNPLLSVSQSCDETAERLKIQLPKNGLRVLQTFELQDVRFDFDACACPHHGTQECDCDLVVLLVYGSEPDPITLILHGSDGHTQIAFANENHQKAKDTFVLAIKRALGDDKTILQ